MNGCEDCIVFRVQNNMIEADTCPECGKKTMVWKLDRDGVPCMKCNNCAFGAAVDQNMPCELDPQINQDVIITVKSQNEVLANSIIELGRITGMNALQMRKALIEGFTVKLNIEKTEKIITILEKNKIDYSLVGYVDYKKRYPFYHECRYPYSAMKRRFL